MDTERQLLFGLLALGAGLIRPSPLATAWAAWSAQPDRPFADLLVLRGYLTPADCAAVEVLLERETKKHTSNPPGLSADERVHRALAALDDPEAGVETVEQSPSPPATALHN